MKAIFTIIISFCSIFLLGLSDKVQNYEFENWQNKIRDDAKLSQLSIPGTHDSATAGISLSAGKCQDKTISEQLKLGVRAFDLRINGKMEIYHGILSADTTLSETLNEIAQFLKTHKTEFVIVSIKDENNKISQQDWTNAVQKILDQKNIKPFISQTAPHDYAVKNIRGKIILLYRYGHFKNNGIRPTKWRNNAISINNSGSPTLNIQDIYNPQNIDAKKQAVSQFLNDAKNNANDEKIWLNFTSVAYKLFSASPFDNAKIMNKHLDDYISKSPRGRYGIIMMDFINMPSGLISKIIKSNTHAN